MPDEEKPILEQIAEAGVLSQQEQQAPPPPSSELAQALFEAFQHVVESAHDHDWKILAFHHEQIGFEHPRQPPSRMTILLIRCFKCGDIQTTNLSGHWSLEEILRTKEMDNER